MEETYTVYLLDWTVVGGLRYVGMRSRRRRPHERALDRGEQIEAGGRIIPPSPRSACGRGSRLTDRRQGGASASHACRGHRCQAGDIARDPTHPKPLQFHRRLNQTFNEHKSPLRYPGSAPAPKYLMRLMFFKRQPVSGCIHLCEEP